VTPAEQFEEVMVTPRWAFPRLPDLRVIERPGWLQIITPSIKTGGLNEVLYSSLDEQTADVAIDDAITTYRDLGLKFRWNAGAGSAPENLGKRLERRGLEASWGRGMIRSTDGAGPDGEVVEVDASTLAAYTDVMATGWSADAGALLAQHRHVLIERRQHLFLVYREGIPAAVAAYVQFSRSAFLMGAVVLPAYRGLGLYRDLVRARLAHARARGIQLATSHAREATSAPILDKLAFETVCRFPMYFG